MPETLINLSLISPSNVGIYASCPLRLVFDTDNPPPYSPNKWADFGTVCHFQTMYKLGCNPPDAPNERCMAGAMDLVRGTEDDFVRRVDLCADKAIEAIQAIIPNKTWLCEIPSYDKSLLPERKGRNGDVKGYGGSIDLMSKDREAIIDLKFKSKPPVTLSVEYLWQLGSYAFLQNVNRTIILYILNDGSSYYFVDLDWTKPQMAMLLVRMRKMIEHMGHKNFRDHAIPSEGDWCEYCTHKHRCPLKHIELPSKHVQAHVQQGDLAWLTRMQAQAAGGPAEAMF